MKGPRTQLTEVGVISRKFVGSLAPKEENLEDVSNGEWGEFYDVAGNALESHPVREARAEKIQGPKKRGTYVKVPVTECWNNTGKAPIRIRFVDVNKGDHM